MPRVFISHSTQDRDFVEQEIVSLLQRHGVQTWYSKDDIPTAALWQKTIVQGLESCDWFLVVLTTRSITSRWVVAEVHWALDERNDNFIPIVVEDCDWHKIHLMMRTIEYVDFREFRDEAQRKLLKCWNISPVSSEHEPMVERPEDGSLPPIFKGSQAVAAALMAAVLAAKNDLARSRVTKKSTKRSDRPGHPVRIWVLSIAFCVFIIGFLFSDNQYCIKNDTLINSIGMEFKLIPAGKFLMGVPEGEPGKQPNEKPPHKVKITRSFYLGVYEVTQAEYRAVMGRNPSWYSPDGFHKAYVAGMDTGRFPVELVSWPDAIMFCNKLSERENLQPCYSSNGEVLANGTGYRLPTEIEWEYACRAGSEKAFSFGATLAPTDANFDENLGRTTSVGSYPANKFGLHDMHGNVWERCSDLYVSEYHKKLIGDDPLGASDIPDRVIRGGSWCNTAGSCRSAARSPNASSSLGHNVGLRLVRVPSG